MSELRRFDDADQAARAAALFILDELNAALQEREVAYLAISGGSTPRKMFEAMADVPFAWEGVRIFFVDERMVPPDHEDSNFHMARQSLFEPAEINEDQVFRIQGELEPPEAARRYAADLRRQFGLENGQLPRFDVVHLGMGDDAHTASLFPGEPLIHDREALVAAVYASAKKTYRVTLLPGPLLKAATLLFLVAGADKAPSLVAVREGPDAVEKYPAQVVERSGADVVWFVDRAAAPN